MLWPVIAVGVGLVSLVISADKFVEGAAATAKGLGVPPLLIGMLVIGFGSSMPEMVISSLSRRGPSLARFRYIPVPGLPKQVPDPPLDRSRWGELVERFPNPRR